LLFRTPRGFGTQGAPDQIRKRPILGAGDSLKTLTQRRLKPNADRFQMFAFVFHPRAVDHRAERRNAPAHRAACYCRDMAENESPKPRFLLTPQQHRRRAQDMREAGRPDLAEHLEKLALAIERAQSQQKSPTE
jgi:hypothetical protein